MLSGFTGLTFTDTWEHLYVCMYICMYVCMYVLMETELVMTKTTIQLMVLYDMSL